MYLSKYNVKLKGCRTRSTVPSRRYVGCTQLDVQRAASRLSRKSEVTELNDALEAHQNVGWLDVSVHDLDASHRMHVRFTANMAQPRWCR